MIITQAFEPIPLSIKSPIPPGKVPEAGAETRAESTASTGVNGLALLSAEAAAMVLAEQIALAPKSATTLDLRGQDLRYVDLSKSDLRGANLTNANLSGMDITGVDLGGAILQNANLSGASLTDVNLNGVIGRGASFAQASLIRVSMNSADFSECLFEQACIDPCKIYRSLLGEKLDQPSGSNIIRHTNFSKTDFSGVTFLSNTYIYSSNLKKAVLNKIRSSIPNQMNERTSISSPSDSLASRLHIVDSDMSGSSFNDINSMILHIEHSDIEGVSFKASSFYDLQFTNVDFRSIDFSLNSKNASNIVFLNAVMNGVNIAVMVSLGHGSVRQANSWKASSSSAKRLGSKMPWLYRILRDPAFADADFSNINIEVLK